MTGTIHPLPSERTPERYRQAIQDALLQYWQRRVWEIEQTVLGVQVGAPTPEGFRRILPEVLFNSVLADTLADIARVAAGQGELSEWDAGVTMEGIQDVMERLFASPLLAVYGPPPNEFWTTPLGQMVALALARVRGDDLITITEAAAILGVTVQAVSNRITAGDLRAIPDPNEPNPQKRNRVLRSEVEALRS